MVFIMPASLIARITLLLWLVLLTSAVHAESFEVSSAQVNKIGNGYVVNAEIKYSLTPRVKEAIENGVRITFYQEFEIIKSIPVLGSYWQWQDTLWSTEIRYELRYHALSLQYVLQSLDTEHQRSFPSLNDALQTLGQINNLSLPPEHLSKTNNLILQLRSGLDLYALPTPMRPGALISSKWQLTSPWVEAQWD